MEKHFAVIGNPVAHSLSPAMHRGGYRELGVEADYLRFQIESGDLSQAVQGLKALGFSGWNVTVPFKEQIIPFLDELTPEALQAGAVNTVKVAEDGRLLGHNTDGNGFVRSLQDEMKIEKGMEVVILGAGGAAKGIAMALIPYDVKITVLNRTPERAQQLVDLIKSQGGDAVVKPWEAGDWLNSAQLLVQTTSLGLKQEQYPFSLRGIFPETWVVDIIFNPWETPFLREARELGCRTLNGVGMLLYQGALAWEFWFGGQAPVAGMKKGLFEALPNKE
ncbi:shikimate dehydrogenase [Desulfitobacterium metallireducens]|uniref:Shikimate dehydrogenase (NADP(+)) n=1 Tax=Desulfitobacterium metallireducens DSM 15288 TaxID=871968 RepID=W0E985_9FIRM|nr:shikimate dehydrogenase [Desulfitobacterium metallireducens]AHF07430.1 shikimate dehydrogenase [Desulfitobacterium metallireducens DSM 15288]